MMLDIYEILKTYFKVHIFSKHENYGKYLKKNLKKLINRALVSTHMELIENL